MAVATGLLVLGMLCAKTALLQPDPSLQLVLGWAAFFMLLSVLPLAFYSNSAG
ncbi:hypothetical protein [Shewanella sp. HN-41]|uniref:hypothetical protein n=1 Tax=Shewanella sp. HN-41 TaxID=327275 RepID=UPI00021257C3|nr:hypothetical protein [Shewanella sp. HN-41]EGM70567.1 hypothetical protein SOHN41_01323 [Shewanella sp. HN-41]